VKLLHLHTQMDPDIKCWYNMALPLLWAGIVQ